MITLTVGAAVDLPVSLAVAWAESSAAIKAESVLEAARSQIASSVTATEIQNLPMPNAILALDREDLPNRRRQPGLFFIEVASNEFATLDSARWLGSEAAN